MAGVIFDVVIDIRRGSPTYGTWIGMELSSENPRLIWIPPGFAHGFCTLAEETEVTYKTTREYRASHDRTIRWNDPTINIEWPISKPHLSRKDLDAPTLDDADNNFVWCS